MTHHIFGQGTVVAADPLRRTVRVQFEGMKMPRTLSVDYFREEHSGRLQIPARPARPDSEDMAVPERISENTFEAEDPEQQIALGPDLERELETIRSDLVREGEAPSDVPAVAEEPVPDSVESEGSIRTDRIDPAVLARLNDADNLWKRDDVPHSGWVCTGVTDLGSPCGICEMCGHQIIRYAHHMVHPQYHPLTAGCVCAGRLEGDPEAARKRERDLKNRLSRRDSFLRRRWKQSRNGNPYLKYQGHLVVLFRLKNGSGWKYAIDSAFADEVCFSQSEAVLAAFAALERME